MSLLSSFFSKGDTSVLGVDIGSSSIKVVQFRKEKGQAVLETYGELALGPYGGKDAGQSTNLSAEQITESLKDLLREAKVTTKNCGISIPFSRSLLSLVELPYRANSAEQKTIIEFEARKYIPVPISEVQLDWFIVPKGGPKQISEKDDLSHEGKVEVLLVAVHNDEISLLRRIVAGSELSASFYEIEIFSTIRAVVEEPVKPIMVLDIGAASTKVYIVEHGVVMLSHSASIGSQDITRAIAVANNVSLTRAEALKKNNSLSEEDIHKSLDLVSSRIFSEVRRVLVQYETSRNKSIASIILTGGGVTKELTEYAKRSFEIEVHVADPFVKIEAPAFMRPVLEDIGPEFSVAVGLALRKLEEV